MRSFDRSWFASHQHLATRNPQDVEPSATYPGREKSAPSPHYTTHRSMSRCPPEKYLERGHQLLRAHVAKGMYAIQLERWFTLLGRENVKVRKNAR